FWASPWGDGRPGWHIECSAMVLSNLGETIDIHCGGVDLTFPHHENEIAQSEAATGKPFARYWMHNGFVNINYEKMSKSAGNFFTVRDLASLYPYSILRFFILQAHYRMPINFSDDLLDAAVTSWQRITSCIDHLKFVAEAAAQESGNKQAEAELKKEITTCRYNWQQAMDDDLNTADAIACLFELVRAANTGAAVEGIRAKTLLEARETIIELFGVLGLEPENAGEKTIPDEVLALVDARTQAKLARDFVTADTIRDEITRKGYRVEDTPQGVRLLPIK
ncbi:MAG TPA: DALR domain-containing protein, partial [Clostridia bacterium]|nr:DALR domain-containing protein [Clostridia bacterium]